MVGNMERVVSQADVTACVRVSQKRGGWFFIETKIREVNIKENKKR